MSNVTAAGEIIAYQFRLYVTIVKKHIGNELPLPEAVKRRIKAVRE